MYTKKPFEHDEMQVAAPSDRRSIKRRHLIYYLRVWDADAGTELGHLVDITTGGLMLVSEREIPVDRDYNLEMRWPGDDGAERVIRFRARSKWTSKDVNPSLSDTGFQLLDDSMDVLKPIQELIDDYGFQD